MAYLSVLWLVMYRHAAAGPSLRAHHSAGLGLDSLSGVMLPVIHPIISAGSNRLRGLSLKSSMLLCVDWDGQQPLSPPMWRQCPGPTALHALQGEFVKRLFGLSYEQMQQKNLTRFHEKLHIDVITKNKSVQYDITAAEKLARLMSNLTKIIILIHGFMESSDGLMVQNLAPELLKRPGLTRLMALDGRNLLTFEYFSSSTYTRFMGEKLGTLLADTVKMGLDSKRLLLVGHSLGAHIAGFAGRHVARLTRQRIGHIVALDPAGPCFTEPSGTSVDRLTATDALRVDVIHTNGGIFGLKEPVGHYDFFPNGGWTQPGCVLALCDHSRAWELYAESITNHKRFPARKCENWTAYRQGRCSKEDVAYMGFDAPAGRPGSYFLITGSKPPFGLGPKSIST